MARKILAFCFVSCLCFSLFLMSAHAFEESDYTESEKAGFAFYKLSKSNPDFEKWIEEYEYYLKAKPSEKIKILHEDGARLQKGFYSYQPDRDLIKFEIDAKIKVPNIQDRNEMLNDMGKIPVKVKLPQHLINSNTGDVFFPFYIGGFWIAMIPDGKTSYNAFFLDEDEYTDFAVDLRMDRYSYERAVVIEYFFRPVSVDANEPINIKSIYAWMMLGEVGYVRIWSRNKKDLVWTYQAPWYVSDTTNDLMHLFKE